MNTFLNFKHYPLSKIIFFLFLIFLPQQFGPHFWPNFSFVHGIRVDYLAPAVYISDVLLILLCATSWKQVLKDKQTKKLTTNPLFLIFVIILCLPLTYALSPGALLYGILKFFEFFYLGIFTMSQVTKKDVLPICLLFLITGFFEGMLSVAQFLNQESVSSIFYFFGERTMFPSTPGAAVINTSHGLVLRPYGTFSHPNVLAFFLFSSFLFGLYLLLQTKIFLRRFFIFFLLFVIQVALFLSFSRILILFNILVLLYAIFKLNDVKNFRKRRLIPLLVLSFGVILFLLSFSERFLFSQFLKSLLPRADLIGISFQIIQTNFLLGVGLNNFFNHEVDFQKNFSDVYLQPVHNIYLLAAAQIGFVGFIIFASFLLKSCSVALENLKRIKEVISFQSVLFTLFSSVLIAGLFDHYFLTIQQGQFLVALILGFIWNKNLQIKEQA